MGKWSIASDMEVNRVLAAELARRVRARKKDCFRNAVLALGQYQGEAEAVYIEGILLVWDRSLQIDHGWLEIGGQVVDPTLLDCEAQDYYPVLRWTLDELQPLLDQRHTLPYYLSNIEWRRQFREFGYALYKELFTPSEETQNAEW